MLINRQGVLLVELVDPTFSVDDSWEKSLEESNVLLHEYISKKKLIHTFHGNDLVQETKNLNELFNNYWEAKNKFHALIYKDRFGTWQKVLKYATIKPE